MSADVVISIQIQYVHFVLICEVLWLVSYKRKIKRRKGASKLIICPSEIVQEHMLCEV